MKTCGVHSMAEAVDEEVPAGIRGRCCSSKISTSRVSGVVERVMEATVERKEGKLEGEVGRVSGPMVRDG